jgi:hypothetical protein
MESATALGNGQPAVADPDAPIFDERRHVSLAGMQEEAQAAPVTRAETLGIFVGFSLLYVLVGIRLIDLHVINFDALDRLTRAFMVWYNDPPKLASIGFSLPPIGTLILVPFAAIKGLVTSGVALPLSSSVFGAGTLVFVNRMFAMGDMVRGARLLIVVLLGLNPMFAFYAMNGTGDAAWMMFAAFGMFCILGWGRNGSARYLIGAGLAFAVAVLARYEFILWGLLLAFLVSGALTRKGRDKDEVEGSVIAYLAPIMYALGIWVFLNAIVLGDPFAWISQASNSAPVNALSSSAPDFSLSDAIGNALRIQLVFPVALLAVPVLLFGKGRDSIGVGIAILIVASIGYSVVSAAVAGSVNVIELQDALPGMIAGCAGIAWAYLRADTGRALLWATTLGLAIISLPLAWGQMQSFPHQNLEQAFTRAVLSGKDQEGTDSRGGFTVGVADEREMARYIEDQGIGSNEILTDNARTFGVIALTGRPDLFFDRVDQGDVEWNATLAYPQGKVDYMLVQRTDADLILQDYPGADDGDVQALEPVVTNDRYALLRVDPGIAWPGPTADLGSVPAPVSSSAETTTPDLTTTAP